MRSKLISISILITVLVFSTLPAIANHFSDVSISADCNSFTIIVTGSVFRPLTVDYSLTLTPSSSGDEIIVEGSSEVPYPPKAFNTAIKDSWGIDLSGVYTVTGTISLVSYDLNPIRIWESRDFNPIILECENITCAECKGKVTQLTLQYNGESPALIEVEQKKPKVKVFSASVQPGETFTFDGVDKKGTLSTEISIFVDGILNTKIHTSCSQPIGPGLLSGDFEVIAGFSRIGGALCLSPANEPPEPPPTSGCDCRGKVTQLTLQYNDTSPALIEVEQKKPKVDVFSEIILPGETFTFYGIDKKGTLSTEIRIYTDGILNTKIHTSCSQPIGPGLISGDFEVIEGFSRGGALCPLIE